MMKIASGCSRIVLAGLAALSVSLSGSSSALRASEDSQPPAVVPSTATGEWPTYGGDLANSKYSPLDQIYGSNFGSL